jgi:hypothetical protein
LLCACPDDACVTKTEQAWKTATPKDVRLGVLKEDAADDALREYAVCRARFKPEGYSD